MVSIALVIDCFMGIILVIIDETKPCNQLTTHYTLTYICMYISVNININMYI